MSEFAGPNWPSNDREWANAHHEIAERHTMPEKRLELAPKMRVFTTGANRDLDDSKLDFDGFLSPLVLERFAQYMHKNRHTANGLRDSDNWQKGIPVDVYRKSGWRHWFECWQLGRSKTAGDALEEALCALLFNIQGWLHEIIKARQAAK